MAENMPHLHTTVFTGSSRWPCSQERPSGKLHPRRALRVPEGLSRDYGQRQQVHCCSRLAVVLNLNPAGQVEDRQQLVETIRRLGSSKFVVTHGTDTMIETAQYVAAAKGVVNKTVVFTGAMRPQKMVDSDAPFNIGVAVGALGVLGSGVYLCMNGRVFEANSVRRDGRTGLFVAV